ncbi:MAG: Endonuclease III, partial [uncultured Gemmatimonadaceae bacterium]
DRFSSPVTRHGAPVQASPPAALQGRPPRARRRDPRPARGRLPRRALRAGLRHAARAARRDDPLGPVHRQAGEHGDAGAVRALPHRGGARVGERGGGGGAGEEHRLLPQQGAEHRRHGAGGGGQPRRRGAARDGRAHAAPRCGAEDGQRGARQRLRREPRRGGGHPRRPRVAAPRAHPRDRPREGGARPDPALPAGAVDAALAPAHRPRPADLRGAAPPVRRVHAGGAVPAGGGGV